MSLKFNPVQCNFETFKELAPNEGYVYFVTDKKQIYLGKDGEKIPMGASSGIYYGIKAIEYENTGIAPDPNVFFSYSDVELSDKGSPEVNDLILNIGTEDLPDGCFYRITRVEDDGYVTTRLTLQGTGGGGNAGGGGIDGPTSANFGITALNNQETYYFSKSGTEAKLGIVAHSSDLTNFITKIKCSFSKDPEDDNSVFYSIEGLAKAMEEPIEIDLIRYLDKFNSSGSTTIYVHAYDKYETSRYKKFTTYVVTLQIATNHPVMLSSISDNSYYISLSGSTALSDYTMHFDFYNDNGDLIYPPQEFPIEKNSIGSTIPCPLNLSTLPHGAYTMKVYFTGKAGINTITSNTLTHKMICYKEGGDPILGVLIPDHCEQYTEIPINYLLVYGDSAREYNLAITLDDEEITVENVVSGALGTYNLIVEQDDVYRLKFIIEELSILLDYELKVVPYDGLLPVINTSRGDLMVYLSPRGRTNSSADKTVWPGRSKVDKENNHKAILKGFHYRTVDGWLRDENNVDYLKIAQGASVEFTDFSPFSQNPNTNGVTVELDFMIMGVSDYDAPLIDCISYTVNGAINTGFRVTGDKFYYYVNGTAVTTLNLVQGKRIKISYVVDPTHRLCYTYLDGIVSHIHKYEENDNFASTIDCPANLYITSTAGQVNMYGVRYYSSALNAQTVVSNYQASLDTLQMREESFLANQIRNVDGIIDLKILESDDYPLSIPIVKLIGGYAILKNDNGDMEMSPQSNANKPALPIAKKDYRAIDMSVHYPNTPYFKDYNDFSITSEFGDSGLNVTNAFGEIMTKGAWMYGQGTSSMEYPVKNLRVKMKGGKIKVQPNLEAVNLICLKADFMESAGAHNTGAANFIDNIAYKNVGMKTPGQNHFSNIDLVTSIKGHPCVVFWSPTGEDGTFRFIGKYNLNLDKATPEPFGFRYDINDPYFGHLTNEDDKLIDVNGNELTEEEITEGSKLVNSIFCFEFLDNNEPVCNFRHDPESETELPDGSIIPEGFDSLENARYHNTWYNANGRINEDKELVDAGWMRGFESRYPEDRTDVHDADALYPLASWINELYALRSTGIAKNEEIAISRFQNEYWKYLDGPFTVAYYSITETLLMADSRVKNMMIATWGKEHRYFNSETKEVRTSAPADMTGWEHSFGYIWYPIFYDMDTMLGLDNIGRRNKNYYDEDTKEDVFNGDEILWKLVRDSLPTMISNTYHKFEEKNAFRKDYLLPCFNLNQADMANETFYNEDAEYKYIGPYLRGESGSRIDPAQGNRSLDREFFIENRLRYLAGKYASEDHVEKDRFFFRLTYPKHIDNPINEEEVKHNESILHVKPSGKFTLKSAKTCYGGVKVGTVASPQMKFIDEEEKSVTLDTSSANGTEVYITGVSSMSDIGDLSDKYPYGVDVNGMRNSAIKKIKLGNSNRHYYNKYFTDDSINLSPLAYLEEFDIQNCGSFRKGVNFKAQPQTTDKDGNIIEATPGCSKIRKINMLGSSASSITLPVGGIIEELRLPTTIRVLNIDSHSDLRDENFTLGYINYTSDTTGDYVNDFSQLTGIYIKNVPLLNTYNILKGNLNASGQLAITDYYIEGFDWTLADISDFEIDANNNIIGIPILDRLSKKNSSGVSREMSLLGSLTIDLPGYNIDEYALYHKYLEIYPNVEIKYSDRVTADSNKSYFNRAEKIYFYRVDASEAPADITTREYYYYTMANGTQKLSDIVANEDFTIPTKMSSNTQDFEFSGIWVDWVTKIEYYQDETLPGATDTNKFSKVIPSADMRLVPKYNSTDRIYNVKFYEFDGSELFTLNGKYGDNVGALTTGKGQYYYRYRSDDGLDANLRYAFRGWKSEKDWDNEINPTAPIDLNALSMTKSMKLYAYYDIENVHTVASDLNLFNIVHETQTINNVKVSGYRVDVKDEFINIIEGKITVPAMFNGDKVTILGKFTGATKMTGLYCQQGSEYTHIAHDSCQNCSGLKTVHLSNTIQHIGEQAFQNNINLTTINLNDEYLTHIGEEAFEGDKALEISKLPDSLIILGVRAFNSCGNGITVNELPDSLTTLGTQCFMSCRKVVLSTFGGGTSNLKTMGYMCLRGTAKDANITTVIINSPIQLEDNANSGYQTFDEAYNESLTTFKTYSTFGYPNEADLAVNLFSRSITNCVPIN